MDRKDTSFSEEVRKKRLAAIANAQNQSSCEAATGGPSSAMSGAGSQLNEAANSGMVVAATAASSSTSANGTVNNSYMLIDTEQLKSVVSSVLPGIVEAVISKVNLPVPAASMLQPSTSSSAQGASGSNMIDVSDLSTTVPGPSSIRLLSPLVPCGVQARQGQAACRSLKQTRALPHYSAAGALCRSGKIRDLGTSNLPMNFVWGKTVERHLNWREYPVSDDIKRRKERDLGPSDLDTVLEFVAKLVGTLNTSLKKQRKKVNHEKVTCSICCDNNITHMLPCRHCFCEPCILQFMGSDDLCPVCRKKFKKYHQLLR